GGFRASNARILWSWTEGRRRRRGSFGGAGGSDNSDDRRSITGDEFDGLADVGHDDPGCTGWRSKVSTVGSEDGIDDHDYPPHSYDALHGRGRFDHSADR